MIRITKVNRIVGLNEAAFRLGVSPSHLHHVIVGDRESRRLRERAAELGIRLPACAARQPSRRGGRARPTALNSKL